MTPYHALRGARRRRHLRLLRRVRGAGTQGLYLTDWWEFRIAERLHRAGLAVAFVARWNWYGEPGGYPFRALVLFESDAAYRACGVGLRRMPGGPR